MWSNRDLLARFESNVQSIQEAGFSRIEWLSAGDGATCPPCTALHGKALPFDEMREIVKNHHCENKEDGCRCGFVMDEKEYKDSVPKPLTEKETRSLKILSRLLNPDYSFSSDEAKSLLTEASKSLPFLATILNESGITINNDTVPEILELLREYLGPYKQFLSPEYREGAIIRAIIVDGKP